MFKSIAIIGWAFFVQVHMIALVVMNFWLWFIAPLGKYRPLSFLESLGLVLFFTALSIPMFSRIDFTNIKVTDTGESTQALYLTVYVVLISLCLLAFGFFVAAFMPQPHNIAPLTLSVK